MKRLLLITMVMLLSASLAFAQGGGVNVFADPAGTDCDILDLQPGLLFVYVVHVLTAGASAVQFSAPRPDCLIAQWLSDTVAWPVAIGNSQSGVAVGYGICAVAPILVLTINYFASGATPPCCLYPVLPDPREPGHILVVDCNIELLHAIGGSGVINPDPLCACQPPLASEQSTWGKVKALYRDE